VSIPQAFVAPSQQLSLAPEQLKQQFEQVNPGLTDADMEVSCGGPYLTAVQICYTKGGQLTQCGADLRDCNQPTLRIPKVQ
jgi:ribonuclease I